MHFFLFLESQQLNIRNVLYLILLGENITLFCINRNNINKSDQAFLIDTIQLYFLCLTTYLIILVSISTILFQFRKFLQRVLNSLST